MNSYTTLCWLIRGGFSSVTFRWSAIFLLVNTGCSCCLIFVPRSPSRLRTTSADFWSLNGNVIRTGLLAGVWTGSVGWWRRLIAESMSFSGYFNFKNIPFKGLSSFYIDMCKEKQDQNLVTFSMAKSLPILLSQWINLDKYISSINKFDSYIILLRWTNW